MADSATVSVKIADAEPVKTLLAGVAEAVQLFAGLDKDTLAATPPDVLDGIDALRKAYGLVTPEPPAVRPPDGADYWGLIVIEWPAAPAVTPERPGPRPMPAWQVLIYDAADGQPIVTAERAVICVVDANSWTAADLTMFCDDEGKPVLRGGTFYPDENGKLRTGTFRYLISEMRVRQGATSHPRTLLSRWSRTPCLSSR